MLLWKHQYYTNAIDHMSTLHLISHTHWDREWYLTFQQFRMKLVHLIDGLLEILENDPDYKYYLLDGQTIILEDYLQIRPEREAELTHLINNGRILIGPWYISPDEFLLSPESHVRNLLEGNRLCQKFGGKMAVGYLPDTFGHIGQLPQILLGFGIDSACTWRGLSDQPLELAWHAPDGSTILLSYLRESYGNAANLSTNHPEKFIQEVQELSRSLAPHSVTGQILLMHGIDHMEPSKDLTKAIHAYQRKSHPDELHHSNLPLYVEAVRSQINAKEIKLPAIAGELRSSKSSPLLPNVLSTRIWLKQRNHECENQLIKWVEPLSAWVSVLNPPPTFSKTEQSTHPFLAEQKSIIRYAWKMLMQNHPHDSICGTSIDQVHKEMRTRFDQVDQISQELTVQNLELISDRINTEFSLAHHDLQAREDIISAIIVFNPNDQAQSGSIETILKMDDHYAAVELIDNHNLMVPHHQKGSGFSELISMIMDKKGLKQGLGMIHDGIFSGVAIREFDVDPQGTKAIIRATISSQGVVDHDKWKLGLVKLNNLLADSRITEFIVHAYSDPEVNLSFVAYDVPGHGYRTYWVAGHQKAEDEARLPRKLPPLFQVFLPALRLARYIPFLPASISGKIRLPERRPPQIENEYLVVDATSPDGTISITDKRTQQVYNGLNRFVDGADCGDLYNYCPAQHDHLIHASLTSIEHADIGYSRSLVIHAHMILPKCLSADRKSRSHEKVRHEITSTITLVPGVPRVDIHVEMDNQASDHRLRVHFPAPFSCTTALHDGHYELVERTIGMPVYDASWVEPPRPEVPQRDFSLVSNGQLSLLVANRGLPEVEVLKNNNGNAEIALTLLRCIGWLSRDDLSTRKGHAGPMGIATPEAQMLGHQAFDYSIIPGDRHFQASIHQAYAFSSPLQSVTASIHPGNLPSAFSFIQNSNPAFVITTIKSGEDTPGLIVRGYNLLSTPIEVALRPFRPFKQSWLVNLAENLVEPLTPGLEGQVDLQAAGKKIITIRLSD
jgi:mannosylglycerate hydrolase